MLARIFSILFGVLLIAVLTPLVQFLTIGALHSSAETSTPVAWAVGLLFSIVLVLAVVRTLSKTQLDRGNLVVVYSMLTIAVPLMNLGLVRQVYLSASSVFFEYLDLGGSTYRTAYNARNGSWFPVVPTGDGLAWKQADRLLRFVGNSRLDADRQAARQAVAKALAAGLPADEADIARLGVDDIEAIRAKQPKETLERLGAASALDARYGQAFSESAQAVESLFALVAGFDEFSASLLPSNLAAIDYSSRRRLDSELIKLPQDARIRLEATSADLVARLPEIQSLASRLGDADRTRLRDRLAARAAAANASLDSGAVNALRESFIYRLTRDERAGLMTADGSAGGPNENLRAFRFGLWNDLASRQAMQRRGFGENLAVAFRAIPWKLWVRPMILWSVLITALFLLVMCVAEWFRRKWVDSENLAFPLVEVADSIIRHDQRLESAEDLRSPEPRGRAFSPLFLSGLALGFLILTLEALGHYQIIGRPLVMVFDVSKEILAVGPLKEIDRVVLVISPIVVGLAFLVNLEISFSIWFVYVVYRLVFWLARGNSVIADNLFTGYGGGRDYPFQMEQLLGASLCFTAILVWKSLRSQPLTPAIRANAFIPQRLNTVGLILLPLLIFGLLWSLGVTSLPLLLLAAVVAAAQSVAAARARAETGLPTEHVSYEFAKLPIVFGLTGMTGAKVFTSFISLAFLPMSMLFAMLPQHLENMELARRFKVAYRTIAVSAVVAFATALVVGMASFVVLSYFIGEKFSGAAVFPGFTGSFSSLQVAHYPLWVSHFFGEAGLTKFTQVHWIRIVFLALGGGVFGALTFLRGRFLKFPVHPLGYLLLLMGLWFEVISPYFRGDAGGAHKEAAWLWGSVFIAWLLKKIIIKYGGMNSYKHAKPFFIGLVVGSVLCVFAWNMTDLIASLIAAGVPSPGGFLKWFLDKPPYSPGYY